MSVYLDSDYTAQYFTTDCCTVPKRSGCVVKILKQISQIVLRALKGIFKQRAHREKCCYHKWSVLACVNQKINTTSKYLRIVSRFVIDNT